MFYPPFNPSVCNGNARRGRKLRFTLFFINVKKNIGLLSKAHKYRVKKQFL